MCYTRQTGNSSVAQSSRAQRSENISARLCPGDVPRALVVCCPTTKEFRWYFAKFPPLAIVLEDCLNGNCEEEVCAWIREVAQVSGRGMCGSWKSATGDNDRNGVFVFHFVVHLTPNDAS